MGLESTAVAPSGNAILDPGTGRPVGTSDSFFTGLSEHLVLHA